MRFEILISFIGIFLLTGCAPKLNYLNSSCRENLIFLTEAINFDKQGRYFLVKPQRFSTLSDKAFINMLQDFMWCDRPWEQCKNDNIRVSDIERLFQIELKYSPLGCYFVHSGQGVLYFLPKEIKEDPKAQWAPDLVFMFSNDGKYIKHIDFSCDLH
jgi:hypothetical protein